MATRYRKPRKLNAISILLAFVAVTGVYFAVQFGPPYWRKWKFKEVLDEAANEALRFFKQPDRLRRIEERARASGKELGIEDAGLRVEAKITEGQKMERQVILSAEYKEHIRHPFVNKTTTLTFRPYIVRSYKPD